MAKARPAKAPKAPPVVQEEPVRPPRPTKAELAAERYPNVEKNPMLQRALAIMRAMAAGKSREQAEALADQKVGPRAPKTMAKKPMKRGKRPEPEKRQRVKPVARAAPARKATKR